MITNDSITKQFESWVKMNQVTLDGLRNNHGEVAAWEYAFFGGYETAIYAIKNPRSFSGQPLANRRYMAGGIT